MTAGKGSYAEVEGRELLCGNEGFLREHGIVIQEEIKEVLEQLRTEGKALILIVQKQCIGLIALSDVLRPKADEMVAKLKQMETKSVLLTGDHQKAANYFAGQIGIDKVCAELLPEEKVSYIAKMQEGNKKVCMIGDGVNDAPALKTADVGVAMGSMGSEIAALLYDRKFEI